MDKTFIDKSLLRDQLFEKYFEVKDGVAVTDLVDKLSFIPELWRELHILCKKNVKFFDSSSSLGKIKDLEHNQKKYLILKLRMFRYIIINMEKGENITVEQFEEEFNADFFVKNFNEIEMEDNIDMYWIDRYNGNVQELVDFYFKNKDILSLPGTLCYTLEIGDASTDFFIDFVNAKALMDFETPDQFLYEQLFLRYDLSPLKMQDTQDRIGLERMREIFEKIKEIKIPKEVIPDALYQQYLIQCSKENSGLKKVLKK